MDKEKDGVNNQAGENKDPDFSENIFVNEGEFVNDDKQLDDEDLYESEINNEVSEQDDSEVSNKEELKEDNISEEEDISEIENLSNEINSEETLDVKEKSNEPDKEEKPNKSGFTKKKKIITGVCLCAALILGIVANNVVSKYEKIVYPRAKLYESNISKLDENSLKEEIENMKNNIGNSKIKIETKNNKYGIKFSELIKSYNEEDLTEEAMSYGKDGNILQQFGIITIGTSRDYTFDIAIDDKAISEFVDKVYEDNSESSIEPKVEINGDDIEIIKGKNGNVVDKNSLIDEIKSTIKDYDGKNKEINLTVNYIEEEPKISISDLEKVDTKISSYSTQYGTGGGRGKNIEVATSKIDDLLLMPGEEFSYENMVGPVSQENGYTYAPVISNGELVQGIGGGVCQVSSTIYNAQLKAGILPTERRNHSKAVSYVPRGLDAT
ncbi:MAG: VanW family protein, partial [Peptostreptococcaceae bacterium]|nr:VanW family protein [Peptostreptococcaceae bacterium]